MRTMNQAYLEATAPVFARRVVDAAAKEALEKAGYTTLAAQLFASRGIKSRRELEARFEDLVPYSEMLGCKDMAMCLAKYADTQEFVLIVSDYDCDGATACTVLIKAFQAAGLNFGYLVPDRLKHGYGLTPSIVDEAKARFPQVKAIITVDNGISSTYGVDRANELGIDVLVTDHHLPPDVLPAARLIVNPNQPGCPFPSKNIAGCGVAWYVAWALHDELVERGTRPASDPRDLLPFVAMGTVADVVKLDLNNRILVKEGLRRIRAGRCSSGIQALAAVSKRNLAKLTTADIGFGLGPRINAAGRLEHMSLGIECLVSDDYDQAMKLAKELHEINGQRQDRQSEMLLQAAYQLADKTDKSAKSIVAYDNSWHEGVVGVVAGRVKELRHRPTFILCDAQDGSIKGSGRSIPGFHLKHALDAVNVRHPGLLLKFGGHAMAAGVSIARGRLDDFTHAFAKVCDEQLDDELLVRKLEHDGSLPTQLLDARLLERLTLEVWGSGMPEPVFYQEIPVGEKKLMGDEKQHLRIATVVHGSSLPVVAFSHGSIASELYGSFCATVKPSLNEFRGSVSVQLMLDTIDPATVPEWMFEAMAA